MGLLNLQSLTADLKQFREIFQKSNVMIVIHDVKGNIIVVNDKVLNSLGYSEAEILSLSFSDLLTKESLSSYGEILDITIRDGSTTKEVSFRKKNSDVFPANVFSNLIEIKSENFCTAPLLSS